MILTRLVACLPTELKISMFLDHFDTMVFANKTFYENLSIGFFDLNLLSVEHCSSTGNIDKYFQNWTIIALNRFPPRKCGRYF